MQKKDISGVKKGGAHVGRLKEGRKMSQETHFSILLFPLLLVCGPFAHTSFNGTLALVDFF